MPRRLGQHFLRRASVERLLDVIDPRSHERFLEIGPGSGALTLPLAECAREVIAVELDEHLAGQLSRRAPDNVKVVQGDALEIDLLSLVEKGDRAVGNLPYAISSPLLRRLVGLHDRVVDLHVMLQAEVADRIAAGPGSKRYGVLSVLFGLWADLDTPLRFAPGCFDPPPRVGSALLRARFREHPRAEVENPAAFERLVKRAFAQRRKTLENNLQDSYPNLKEYLKLVNIVGTRRAETLSVVEFARLSAVLKSGPV